MSLFPVPQSLEKDQITMKHHAALTSLIVLFTILASGCYHTCQSYVECGPNQICEDGLCQDYEYLCDPAPDGSKICPLYCDEKGPYYCGINQTCLNGVCTDIEVECYKDEDCNENHVCISYMCIESSWSSCLGGCPSGTSCYNGKCVELSCHSDEECPEGMTCTVSVCIADYDYCETQNDCPSDYFCVDHLCKEINIEQYCDYHADCNDESMCVEGLCVPNDGVKCKLSLDCHEGYVCTTEGYCEKPEETDI